MKASAKLLNVNVNVLFDELGLLCIGIADWETVTLWCFFFPILSIVSRGGTVHVFVPNPHGTDISVRCMRPYNKYRQFTPNPEGGARSNAMLFDNRQQKNSECRELRT